MKQHPPTETSNPLPRPGAASSGAATHCHPFLFLRITRENRSSCPPPSVQTGHGHVRPRASLLRERRLRKPHPLPPRAGGAAAAARRRRGDGAVLEDRAGGEVAGRGAAGGELQPAVGRRRGGG